MHVTISSLKENIDCTWCERENLCVTVDFSDGFLRQAALCWRCLQKAVRVRYRDVTPPAAALTNLKPNASADRAASP